jgi:hypothetical protein
VTAADDEHDEEQQDHYKSDSAEHLHPERRRRSFVVRTLGRPLLAHAAEFTRQSVS